MDVELFEDPFEERKLRVLAECKLAPEVFQEVVPRLEAFMQPFVERLHRCDQGHHARTMIRGLVSDLKNKNVESIAYLHDQDRNCLQHFMGVSKWNDSPLRDELARQIGRDLEDPNGVLVFDPSGFPKSGRESVGVARQWCGRLGKVDNCQVGVYLGYVSSSEHALVDVRLFLPREWTQDKERLKKAGVPGGTKYRTRHELALEMLDRHGPRLPHRWIAGDDEMGRPAWFRRDLRDRGEQYLLAIPCNTLIRDLEVEPPARSEHGRPPMRPWQRVDAWLAKQPASGWTKMDVRDGSKGPLIVEILKRRVAARAEKYRQGPDEVLVVIRYRDRDDERVVKTDYYVSNAAAATSLMEFARVAKAEHRIEECLQRSKSEAGLGDYEVRTWTGWHHHQTLSLIATWFLVTETRRGKKMDARHHAAANPLWHLGDPRTRTRVRSKGANRSRVRTASATQRTGTPVPLEAS